MLASWDRLQDLRRGTNKPTELDPEAVRAVKGVTTVEGINHNADRIEAYTTGLKEGRRMSKLGAIAERIAAKKQAHDAKADEWAGRLDALDRKEPESFAIGDAVIEERETDLADMERNMRAISNLPNVVSGKSG